MKLRWITSVIAILVGLLACLGLLAPVDFIFAILTGWGVFLYRTVPQMTVDWGGVLLALATLGLFTIGLHRLCAWLYREMGGDESPVRRWKRGWSATIVTVIVLMFCAGISAVGMVHQAIWLVSSGEPLLNSSAKEFRRTASKGNLYPIGLAMYNYQEIPAAFPAGGTFDQLGNGQHGWITMLLPYIDRQSLSKQIDLESPWNAPHNAEFFRTRIPLILNPGIEIDSNPDGFALAHYAANARIMSGNRTLPLAEITDNSAHTILVGEVAANFQPWGHPVNWRDPAMGINKSPYGFGGPWDGGIHFLFVDGSVHFVNEMIDPKVLRAMSTPAAGDEIPDF